MYRIKIHVKGYVQGVGFRYFVYREARRLLLTGFVRNEYDGSVLIEAQGDIEDINSLIQVISGSFLDIDDIETFSLPVKMDEMDFRIVY